MRVRLLLAPALTAILAAACGGEAPDESSTSASPTSAPATSTTAEALTCDSILSLDDVAALFGEPAWFDQATSESVEGFSCVWQTEATSLEEPRQFFQIQVYEGLDYYVAAQLQDVEALTGIGDEAYFSPELGVSVGFREGDTVVMVTYSTTGEETRVDPLTRKDQVIALLRLIHDRTV